MAPLSWKFSGRLVSASASSGIWGSWCGIKSPLVRRWCQYLLSRPRALSPVCWCAPQDPACWPGSWVIFRPTSHNLSRCHSHQNWPPMWCHCQGRQADWEMQFDHVLVVHDLNFFYCSLRLLEWQGWGRRYHGALGPCRRCWHAPVRQAYWLIYWGHWVKTLVRLGERQLWGWPDRWSERLLVPPYFFVHIGCEPWCSRGPRRTPVATIFLWSAPCTGTIGSPVWKCIGLHTLHARPVRTSLGYCEGYMYGVCGRPCVHVGPS